MMHDKFITRFIVAMACFDAFMFAIFRMTEGGSNLEIGLRTVAAIVYLYYAYAVLRRGVQ